MIIDAPDMMVRMPAFISRSIEETGYDHHKGVALPPSTIEMLKELIQVVDKRTAMAKRMRRSEAVATWKIIKPAIQGFLHEQAAFEDRFKDTISIDESIDVLRSFFLAVQYYIAEIGYTATNRKIDDDDLDAFLLNVFSQMNSSDRSEHVAGKNALMTLFND